MPTERIISAKRDPADPLEEQVNFSLRPRKLDEYIGLNSCWI